MANVVEFSLRAVDQFSSTFKNIGGTLVSTAGKALKSTVGFSALSAATVALIKQVPNLEDNMGKMATKLGTSAEALSGLTYAAGLADVSFESLSNSLKFMERNVSEAARGTQGSVTAFKELGIEVSAVKDLKPEDQMLVFADALKGVSNSSDRARLAMEVFGRSGLDLLELTKDGSAGIKAMTAEAAEFGAVISGQAAANAAEFNDSMSRLWTTVKGASMALVDQFIPIMTGAFNAVARFVSAHKKQIADFATSALDGFLFVAVAAGQILEGIWKAIKRTFSAEGFDAFVEGAKQAFMRVFEFAVALVPNVVSVLVNMFKTAAIAGWELMKWGWEKIKALFTGDDVPSLGDTLFNTIPQATEEARANIAAGFSAASKEVVSFWDDVGAGIASAVGFDADKVRAIVDTIKAKFTEMGTVAQTTGGAMGLAFDQTATKLEEGLRKNIDEVTDSLRTEEERIQESYTRRLFIIEDSIQRGLISQERGQALGLKLEQQYAEQLAATNEKIANDRISAVSQMFGNLASLSSSHSKKEFERGKKFAKVQAAIDASQAAIAAYKALAGIPFVGPALGVAAAAAALLYGRQRIAEIDRQQFQGSAHAGLTTVPENQTLFLKRGERVVTQQQNQDLTRFLAAQQEASGERGGATVVIEHLHILENATNFNALMNMDAGQIERVISDKLIPAFRKLAQRGIGGRVPQAKQGLVNW